MRIAGGGFGGGPLLVGEQLAQFTSQRLEALLTRVEHLGDGPPRRPAGQNLLLGLGGGPVFILKGAQDADGREVALGARHRT